MRIVVKVFPRAKENQVLPQGNNKFKVKVTATPKKGKANKAALRLLSDYFKIPKQSIFIIQGEKSRQKLIEIEER